MRRRFDSIRFVRENDTDTHLAPRLSRVSPASAFDRRPRPVARLRLPRRRRILPPPHPPGPARRRHRHRESRTHTHTGLNAPRLRKTTRCLPREIKNKNTYPSHLSSVYDPSVPPSYTHTCSDIRKPTVGPDATETEDDAVVVRLRRRRAFVRASVRSIDRARRSRSRRALCAALARACAVEEEARGVVVVAVVPIERTRDGRTDRTRA